VDEEIMQYCKMESSSSSSTTTTTTTHESCGIGGCFFPLMHVSFRAFTQWTLFFLGVLMAFLVDKSGTIITSNWDWVT
jgi:hypothetical protein